MSYYMGDFYPGRQNAMGDPGFFSFLGGLAKKAVGFIPGVGPVASAALSMVHKPGALKAVGTTILKKGAGAIVKHPVLSAAGAAGALAAGGVAVGRHIGMGGHKMRINPRTGKAIRRMRVTNPRALRRALRRADGFARFAMHCIKLTHPHKKGRFGGFKMKRKRK